MEKVERLVLPNVWRQLCPVCQAEQTFISTEQATFLTRLTARQIFRLVEIEVIHFFETKEGFLFICENSLNISSREKLLSEGKETKIKQIAK